MNLCVVLDYQVSYLHPKVASQTFMGQIRLTPVPVAHCDPVPGGCVVYQTPVIHGIYSQLTAPYL